MKSFKDYAKQPQDAQPTPPKNTQPSQGADDSASAEELTKRIAAAYNGRSNAQMLQNILYEAEKSKRAGTLSNEEIETFYQNFSPMLNGFQRKKLREIVNRLKEI